MNKAELNHENLSKALVSYLNSIGQNRETVVLNVFRHGWTIGSEVRRGFSKCGMTSADNGSRAYTVAARLLSDIER